jgi:SDR family mycofactocin-dependent oxidoreductase
MDRMSCRRSEKGVALMQRLAGKTAFITGGARGQGRAIALRFAKEGANIVICDIGTPELDATEYALSTTEDLEATKAAIEEVGSACIARIADVRDRAALQRVVDEAIEHFSGIDILIANAGIVAYHPFWEITEDEWRDQIDINLSGAWRSAAVVAPHMIERGSGSIVFTSSVVGIEAGRDYMHYIAAKHGVIGIMRAAALELGPHGIRVNAILPGPTDTPINDNPHARDWIVGHKGATREEYLRAIPHWHLLRGVTALPAEAIADAMTWLVSDEARYITGLQLVVDAGHTLLPGRNSHQTIDEDMIAERLAAQA